MGQQKWLIEPGDQKTIEVDDVRRLKIGLVGGQVDVIGHDEPTVRIEVHSVSGRDLKITQDEGSLEIDHPQLRWDNFIEVFKTVRSSAKADVSVLVPRNIALTFGVVSATALVAGLHTDAKLSTVSGDLVIDALVGDLDLNAVSGELSVRDHDGRIAAHTVSGDITASGRVRRITTDSVSGDVLLDLTGTPDEIRTNSVSGDATVRIPEAAGARYRVNSVSGRIQLDNGPVTRSPGRSFSGTTGSLDGTWVDIYANSVSGNVSVLRRAAADDTASADDPAAAGAGDGEHPDGEASE